MFVGSWAEAHVEGGVKEGTTDVYTGRLVHGVREGDGELRRMPFRAYEKDRGAFRTLAPGAEADAITLEKTGAKLIYAGQWSDGTYHGREP